LHQRPGGPDLYNASASLLLVAYTGVAALLSPDPVRWIYLTMLACSLAGVVLALRGIKAASGLAVMAACATYPILGLWTAEPTTSTFSEILWMIVAPGLGSIIVPLRYYIPTGTAFFAVIFWLLHRNPEVTTSAANEIGLGVALVTGFSTVGAWQLERQRRGLLNEVAERRDRERRLEVYSSELELLGAIGRRLVTNPALPGNLVSLCHELRQRLDLALVAIYLLDDDGDLRHLVSDGYDIPTDVVLQRGQPSLLQRCVASGEPVYEADVERTSTYLSGHAAVRSEYVVPLRVGQRLVGGLNLESSRPDDFSVSRRRLIQRAADLFASALDREQIFDALVEARDDLMTANSELEERVEQRAAELLDEVSERRRTEAQLLAANRELEGMHEQLVQLGKLAAVGELGAGIAHELNQPLAAIEYFADSLRRDPDRRIADCEEELHVVQEQGRRMARLVDNLRAFSRRSSIRLQRLEPLSALRDALTLLQAPLGLASVTVVERHDDELPEVKGDAVLLQQVFVNLLSNSLQALERLPAGEPREIVVAVTRDGDGVRFTIEDSGPGIPDELEQRVFEPFFTTREDRGGTGLGLTLSARIVQRHGSEMVYRRSEAGGAHFHWSLPLAQPPSDTPAKPLTPPLEEAGRVLAVDDEAVVLFGLQRLLRAWGWDFTSADSAAAALAAMESGEFDVALVDLRMPGISGLELIEQLRHRAPQMRIIATSGYVSEEDRENLGRLGVYRILPKPVPSEVLRSTLSDAMAGRPMAEEVPQEEETYSSWLRSETPRGGWTPGLLEEGSEGERILTEEGDEE